MAFQKTSSATNHPSPLLMKTQVYFVLCIFWEIYCEKTVMYFSSREKMAKGNENDTDVLVSRKTDFSFIIVSCFCQEKMFSSKRLIITLNLDFNTWQQYDKSQGIFTGIIVNHQSNNSYVIISDWYLIGVFRFYDKTEISKLEEK